MILESDAKSAEDKAELFYEVGSLYDDLGLEAMARFMLMNSIVISLDLLVHMSFWVSTSLKKAELLKLAMLLIQQLS